MKAPYSVGLVSTGAFAPPRLLTNAELAQMVDTSDEWIQTRSGIVTRHISGPDMATSDLAFHAAQQALERAELSPEELDVIVVGTVTPDTQTPSTACLLQHRLGATQAAAFDVGAACSGFIYALTVSSPMVATGMYRNALVIGADTLSRITDFTDRGTCVLLGDGAGATVLKPVPEGRGILATYLRADGGGADLLAVPAGGSRRPSSAESVAERQHYLQMNGSAVFRFAIRALEDAVQTVLERAQLTPDDIDLIIPHQANLRIIDSAAKNLGIPRDRWVVNLQRYGNTSSGSIPLALNEAYEEGRIHEGSNIVMVSFGGGLTWGAVALRW